jgi:hypothetical protein
MQSSTVFLLFISFFGFWNPIYLEINQLYFRNANVAFGLEPTTPKSPYHHDLQDCSKGNYTVIRKKTDFKGIVCPMIKDEIGFLAEWTAFYEMMGFDHVIYFDHNSTSSLAELDPWVKTGFVEIVSNWWVHELKFGLFKNPKRRFFDMMRVKYLSEVICKQKGIELGYDVFLSADLDEFLFPSRNDWTTMDEMAEWFQDTQRRVMPLDKMNFNPTPHFLEPVNLLVIEAFVLRMKEPNKMNYYKNIGNFDLFL